MGRLFWKFFFGIWLAQLTGMSAVGIAFWLHDKARQNAQMHIDTSPPARFMVQATSSVLQLAGQQAVIQLLASDPHNPVVVLDSKGQLVAGQGPFSLTANDLEKFAAHLDQQALAKVRGPAGEMFWVLAKQRGRGSDVSGGPAHVEPPKGMFPLLPLLSGLVASLLFAGILAWYFSKPIKVLRTAFEAVSEGDLGTRIAHRLNRKDELSDLSDAFDQMADQLQRLMEGQQRLLHDVSHELRSPLARLQAAIGLARQQPDKFEKCMSRIESESERMDELIGELLTLSRLEAGVANQQTEEHFSVQELLSSVVSDASFEAEQHERSVSLECEQDAQIFARPALMQRAIENIVRNAIRYTEPHSTVFILLTHRAEEHMCSIKVQDKGPGIPLDELHLIFTPFYRASNGIAKEGYGLGLTIAKRVIEAAGGKISARNRAEGGLCVEMLLPISQWSAEEPASR